MQMLCLGCLASVCSRVTGRHRKALNRVTLLVNGQDWVGNAPAHAYQKTTAISLPARLIKRGLSLADIGTHPRPIQRKIAASGALPTPIPEPSLHRRTVLTRLELGPASKPWAILLDQPKWHKL